MYKIIVFAFVAVVILAACNPSKRLNQQVAARNAQPQQITIKYPIQHVPTPANINYLYDYEGLFNQFQVKQIDSLVRNFEGSNLIAIKVLTISGAMTTDNQFEQYTQSQLAEWDKMHGNTGKTAILAFSKSLNRLAIINGSFTSKLLPTASIQSIENETKDAFSKEAYFDGTISSLNKIMDAIRKNISF